jgi:hypothetical protein
LHLTISFDAFWTFRSVGDGGVVSWGRSSNREGEEGGEGEDGELHGAGSCEGLAVSLGGYFGEGS